MELTLMPLPNMNSELAHPAPGLNRYETDFYAWTQEQAALLRNHQWSRIDLAP